MSEGDEIGALVCRSTLLLVGCNSPSPALKTHSTPGAGLE